MKREEALRAVSVYASEQWGLFTSAQALLVGVSGVDLLRMREAELIETAGRGVHLVGGATVPEHLEIKVAWLQLAPKRGAWERLKPGAYDGVVSHGSACQLHQLGDIPSTRVELSVPRRRTTRLSGVHLRVMPLQDSEVSLSQGLPVTSATRTIVDLLGARTDGAHAGGVIADALQHGLADRTDLARQVARFARAYGLGARASGEDVLDTLIEQAGARSETVSNAQVIDASRRILALYAAADPLQNALLNMNQHRNTGIEHMMRNLHAPSAGIGNIGAGLSSLLAAQSPARHFASAAQIAARTMPSDVLLAQAGLAGAAASAISAARVASNLSSDAVASALVKSMRGYALMQPPLRPALHAALHKGPEKAGVSTEDPASGPLLGRYGDTEHHTAQSDRHGQETVDIPDSSNVQSARTPPQEAD